MTRNRSWSFLIIVFLLGAMAFSGTDAAASGADVQRPLKVSLDFLAVEPTFDCAAGLVPQGAEGSGRLSHLGTVEISGGQCNNFATLEFTDGFGTYVAANADSIDVTYSGQASLSPVGFDGEGSAAIVGGTGRFEGASGEFDFTFTTYVAPDGSGRTLLDGDGWITYDASNRRDK
jgi:hypothetical protein